MIDLPMILTRALLYAVAAAQCWLAWSFWQSYAGDGEVKWLLPLFGVALALIEVFALVVAARADGEGRKSRALLWRGVWAVLLVVNFAAEIGAFANVIAAEEGRRSNEIAHVQQLQADRDEQAASVAALTAELAARHADKPIAALEVELGAARALAASYAPPRPRDAREIARLESALISARARETARAARDRLDAEIAAQSAPSSQYHPQLVTLARLLDGLGVRATPGDVEAFIPLGLALVMKLVLTFGFWVTAVEAPTTQPAQLPKVALEPKPTEAPKKVAAPPKRRRRKRREVTRPVLADDGEPWRFVFDEASDGGRSKPN